MDVSRRRIVVGGCAAALGGCATAGGQWPLGAQAASPRPALFDWSNPEDNLTGLVKVFGDLSGAPVWLSAQGRIHGIREGEMPLPMLGVEGVRRLKFEKIDTGYRMITRDWAVYRDIDTGAVLETYDNPITGETVTPTPILTRLISWDMTPDKGQQMPEYGGEAWLIDRPLILPWTQEGDDVSLSLELLVKYQSGVGGGEWEHLLTSADELNDPDRTATSARQAWTGHSPWMRWLDMGDRPGRTLWQSTGRKHFSVDALRPEFVDAVNTFYPGSLEAPETYEKPKII